MKNLEGISERCPRELVERVFPFLSVGLPRRGSVEYKKETRS
jgi:hypothetical protein